MVTFGKRFSARVVEAFKATGLPAALAVRAAAKGQPAEILLYDEIGPWGVTAQDFAGALAAAGKGDVRVRINSPGGSVFDGMAIYNLLLAHQGNVDCVVDGIAASAASFVAMAGKSLTMQDTSMLMIHNAWTVAVGNRHDMAEVAGVMAKLDGQMAAIYSRKTGSSVEDVAALMDAETWLTSSEAMAGKFCDSVLAPPDKDGDKARALAGAVVIRAAVADPVEAPAAPVAEPDNDARAQRMRRLRLAEHD